MPDAAAPKKRLNSWKEIASYVGWDVRTVIRWEKSKGLPVRRVQGGKRQAVFAYPEEIDRWLNAERSGLDESVSPRSSETAPVPLKESADVLPVQPIRRQRWWFTRTGYVVATLITLMAVGQLGIRSLAKSAVQVTRVTQLTHDGKQKLSLVTDGRQLYFGHEIEGKYVLSSIPLTGGAIRRIPVPFLNGVPQDVSADGTQLLVLGHGGLEKEQDLWIVPTDGELPRRVGSVQAHSATWSPDGYHIVFANGNAIYVTADEGATTQQVFVSPSIPYLLRWSPDGKHVRFVLYDPSNWQASPWELALGERGQPLSAARLEIPVPGCCSAWSAVDRAGTSFVAPGGAAGKNLWMVNASRGWWGGRAVKLTPDLDNIEGITSVSSGNKIYVLSNSAERGELVRFEVQSRAASPFIAGLSASFLDFSRDGKRIAYVHVPNQTLASSHADGSGEMQYDFSADTIELPRWSPDGQTIAFTAKRAQKPWRIYVVPTDGGPPREASEGDDNQGAPTWSPDGKYLVYANVNCQETHSCAIHQIEIGSGKRQILEGSDGLRTARWSPDGNYVAALDPEKHRLVIFDFRTHKWKQLAESVTGDNLSWSSDSRYLYADRPNVQAPEIMRVPVDGGRPEAVLDLRDYSRLAGSIRGWFSLAPDGSIIVFRWLNGSEIYALDLKRQ